MHAGHHVEDRDPRPVRRSVGVPGQAHQAGDGLHHEVVAGIAGTGAGPEAADRRVDDRGIGGRDRLVVQAEPAQPPGPEVLDHHVGACGELAGDRHVVRVLQVERDGSLVAVDAEEVRRLAVAHRWHPGPGVVAARTLHLDHLGAEVREQHGGVRSGQDAGEVGDQQPAQWSHAASSECP
jgi:hypothetical protein